MKLDRTLAVAFAWGFAEATFFFLVPDVCLTFLALRSFRTALRATGAALAGALLGGAFMFWWGAQAPETARAFLVHIPAIHAAMVSSVHVQLQDHGLLALLLGPLRGTPYKVYAVEWSALDGGFVSFMLMSIPARYPRFLLSAAVAGALARFVKLWMLALCWLAFYVFYFWKFGW